MPSCISFVQSDNGPTTVRASVLRLLYLKTKRDLRRPLLPAPSSVIPCSTIKSRRAGARPGKHVCRRRRLEDLRERLVPVLSICGGRSGGGWGLEERAGRGELGAVWRDESHVSAGEETQRRGGESVRGSLTAPLPPSLSLSLSFCLSLSLCLSLSYSPSHPPALSLLEMSNYY